MEGVHLYLLIIKIPLMVKLALDAILIYEGMTKSRSGTILMLAQTWKRFQRHLQTNNCTFKNLYTEHIKTRPPFR